MEIPVNIKYILERIYKSEDEWKALYMAVWDFSNRIENREVKSDLSFDKQLVLLNSGQGTAMAVTLSEKQALILLGDYKILGLPASKNLFHTFKTKELLNILRSRDGQFTLGHLQTLFSLFEELIRTVAKDLFSLEIDDSGWGEIVKFFNRNETKDILSENEINELKLAKETRNCFIHNGSKVDGCWIEAYQKARGNKPVDLNGKNLNEGLSNIFHEIENWHELIVNVAKRIEEKIIQI